MQTGIEITISCEKGKKHAHWSSNGSQPAIINASKGDVIHFKIDAPGGVAKAMLQSSAIGSGGDSSPFGSNPIDLVEHHFKLTFGNTAGRWSFAITIDGKQDAAGIVDTAYLANIPELEVGSVQPTRP